MRFSLLLAVGFSVAAGAQETHTPNDLRDRRAHAYALTHATVTTSPGTRALDGRGC